MDSMSAFAMGRAARAAGAEGKVFDWERAARILVERHPNVAVAGLAEDMEWTSATVWRNGAPAPDRDGAYLFSLWATPILEIDGESIECWLRPKDAKGWSDDTWWPPEALAIVRGE